MSNVTTTGSIMAPKGMIRVTPFWPTQSVSETSLKKEKIHAESPRVSEIHDKLIAPNSLDEILFDNAVTLKVSYSHLAMHLNAEWRIIIFNQLDRLLRVDNWEDDSAFIKKSPFLTFLRFIIYSSPTRFPSLGVSPKGNILSAWLCPTQHMTIEFLEMDKATATFSIQTRRSKETIAWRGHVADLKDFIERNDLSNCIRSS